MMLYYTNSDNITLPEVILAAMKSSFRHLLDRLGAAGSLVCALHCALVPLLLALAPSLGLSLWLGESLEEIFVVFVTVLGAFSLIWGYRRHRVFRALGMLLAVPISSLTGSLGVGRFIRRLGLLRTPEEADVPAIRLGMEKVRPA